MPTYEPWDTNKVLDVDIDGNRPHATTVGNSITSMVASERGRISNPKWEECFVDGSI
jgi:hypothetical protein